jgi:2-octaprenyl-6-methoxyphenol hydroxylase
MLDQVFPSQAQPILQSLDNSQAKSEPLTSRPIEFDVAIVGGGIVGLTVVCALQQSGLRVALIEANPPEAGLRRERAYAITLMSGKILSGLGIWDQILPQITSFREIRLAEEHDPAVVHLQPEDLGMEELGYVVEHRVLLKALQHKAATANLTWLCPAELIAVDYQPEQVVIDLAIADETWQIRTRLLIAADGARSPIRQKAGISTTGWQYWQSCITTVIRPELGHGNIAREHFWPSGPFATLPLPENRAQIVLTAPHTEAKAMMQLSPSEFLAELNRRYQGQLGELELLSDRLLFPVQLMQSDRYVQHRLALVGDAAHCCHPVGGQGLNLGIRDAVALAQVLETAHQRGEDIGQLKVLRRYEHWRKWENWLILGFTDLLDRLFSNRWWPLLLLRRLGLRAMKHIRLLRFLALRLMTGLSGRMPRLAHRS